MTRRVFDLHRAERTATRRVERVATAVVVLALMGARQVIIRTPRRAGVVDPWVAADHKRVRAELRHRIDHCREVGVDFEDVLRWIANENPDLANEALDEAGAPR